MSENALFESVGDMFYANENASSETDSSQGTTVEADAVESGVQSPDVGEVADIEQASSDASDIDASSVDSDDGGENSIDDSNEPLYFQIGDEEISEAEVKSWRDGHLRQQDYTKKTQALADERKTLEAQATQVGEIQKNLTETLENLEKAFEKESDQIDWEHLREYDTAEYLRLKDEQAKKADALKDAKAQAESVKKAERDAILAREQQRLIEMFPAWGDPGSGAEAYKADIKLINDYVTDAGFSQEEFSQLENAHVMQAIYKAAKYDAMQKSGSVAEKQVRKAPKVVKPTKKTVTKPKSAAERFYGTK